MNADVSAAVGFAAAGAVTFVATPVAIAVAQRTDFRDHPREYRQHAAATPLLGGAAVLAGFLVAAIAVGGVSGKHTLIACALGMWLLGTIDDRFAVAPKWRLLAEVLAGVALVSVGLGWSTSAGGLLNFVLTVAWIAGIVNAFNLMDNLDGACSAVGSVCAIGIGTLAAIHGLPALAGLSFATAGACAGFLPWNLAGPAKIFLGDGGSMPIGFMVATLSMATARGMIGTDSSLVIGGLLAGGLLVGVPILDTALVSISRLRRGVTLVTGGRDHLTHRLLRVLGSPHAVAGTLALCQAFLCALAIVGDQLGAVVLTLFAISAVLLGLLVIAVLDTTRWRPAGIAVSSQARRRTAAPEPVGSPHVAAPPVASPPVVTAPPVVASPVGVDSG